MAKATTHSIYVFDGFRLDGDKLMLYRGELPTALPPRAVETLAVLVRQYGEIVSKDELIDAVWKGSCVEESNLTQYLYLVRKTLGTRENGKPYIETLRKRGYRFGSDSFEIVNTAGGSDQESKPEGAGQAGSRAKVIAFSARGEAAADRSAGTEASSTWASRSGRQKILLFALAQVVLLLVVGAVGWLRYGPGEVSGRTGQLSVARLTNGLEVNDAAISPDGKYFAYSEVDGKRSRIWVQQTGQSNRLEIVPWADHWYGAKTFTPDGQSIYYIETDPQNGNNLYRVPTLGGQPAKVLSGIDTPVSFSPDGREFTYGRTTKPAGGSKIIVKATDGMGEERTVYSRKEDIAAPNVAWSPDGKTIAFTSLMGNDLGGTCKVSAVDLSDHTVRTLHNEPWEMCYRLAWSPNADGLYMIATKDGDGYSTRRDQLYYLPISGEKVRRLSFDGSRNQPNTLTVTADNGILVVPFNRSSQIWSMDPSGESRSAEQITTGLGDGRAGIAPMADGRVAYIARSPESLNIWTMNPDGSDQKQLTTEPQFVEELRSGGDGRYLYFSAPNGRWNSLFRIGSDGGDMQQVTSGMHVIDSGPSHDGKWVAYGGSTVSGLRSELTLWKMPVDGGQPIRFDIKECGWPHFSPDDKFLSCVQQEQQRIYILSSEDGHVITSFAAAPRATLNFGARWSPDGKAVVYIVTEKDVSNLWLHPIDGSAPRRLTDFTAGSIYHFAYSLDSKRLYIARGTQIRDAILITDKAQ